MRLGLALDLRLPREARAGAREDARGEADDARGEVERDEAPETERPEAEHPERLDYTERDRDRETERASFPLLLKTLNGVVADGQALPGPPAAELLTLRELLAKVGASPTPEPPSGRPLRARLAGSAAATLATAGLTPRSGPRSGPRPGPMTALRRATGPP